MFSHATTQTASSNRSRGFSLVELRLLDLGIGYQSAVTMLEDQCINGVTWKQQAGRILEVDLIDADQIDLFIGQQAWNVWSAGGTVGLGIAGFGGTCLGKIAGMECQLGLDDSEQTM